MGNSNTGLPLYSKKFSIVTSYTQQFFCEILFGIRTTNVLVLRGRKRTCKCCPGWALSCINLHRVYLDMAEVNIC